MSTSGRSCTGPAEQPPHGATTVLSEDPLETDS